MPNHGFWTKIQSFMAQGGQRVEAGCPMGWEQTRQDTMEGGERINNGARWGLW